MALGTASTPGFAQTPVPNDQNYQQQLPQQPQQYYPGFSPYKQPQKQGHYFQENDQLVPDYVNINHLPQSESNYVEQEVLYEKTESYSSYDNKQFLKQESHVVQGVFKQPRVEYCYEEAQKTSAVTVDVKSDGKPHSSPDRSPGSLTDDFSTGKYSDSGFDSVSREDVREASRQQTRVANDVWRTANGVANATPAKNLVQERIKAFEVRVGGSSEDQSKYSPTATEPEIVAAFSGRNEYEFAEASRRPVLPPKPRQESQTSEANTSQRLSLVETLERSIREGSDSDDECTYSAQRRHRRRMQKFLKASSAHNQSWLVDGDCDEEPEGLVDEGDEISQQQSQEQEQIDQDQQSEDHYLVMTPQKAPQQTRHFSQEVAMAAVATTPSESLVMESLMRRKYEENTYVDMAEDGGIYTATMMSQLTLANARGNSVFENEPLAGKFAVGYAPYPMDSPKYCEIPEETNHYELLSKSYSTEQPGQRPNGEPIYNEVAASEYEGSKLTAIPDIVPTKSGFESDSASDADDEASKDLDAIKTKPDGSSAAKKGHHQSQKRFSLSDTFRPASYYLPKSSKNGVNVDESDGNQSSDSDLVPPPPIPSSPPPMEDFQDRRATVQSEPPTRLPKRSPRISTEVGLPSRSDLMKAPDPPGKLRMTLSAARKDVEKRKSLEVAQNEQIQQIQNQPIPETPRSPLETELNYSYYRVYGDDRARSAQKHPPQPPASAMSNNSKNSRHGRTNSTASSDSNRSSAPYYYSDLVSLASGGGASGHNVSQSGQNPDLAP